MYNNTHTPHVQSRLNPGVVPFAGFRLGRKRKLSVAQGRGTMSMPTSPLGQSINNELFPWDSGPQSAQAFFSQSNGYTAQPQLQSPFNTFSTQPPAEPQQTFIAPSSFFSISSDHTISPPNRADGVLDDDLDFNADHDHDIEFAGHGQGDDVPPPKKKRAQVRVACTHCQKACKKCSNTRPCERCVKYGLEDCVDSLRKPRKTGVKRGPYKRRTSSLYTQQPGLDHSIHQSHLLNAQTQTQFKLPRRPPYRQQQHTPGSSPPITGLGTKTISQAFAAAFDGPRWINGRRQSISQNPSQPQGHQMHQEPARQVNPYAPITKHTRNPPKARIPCIIPSVTGTGGDSRRGSMSSIFPMGLNTQSGQDPFSRTVSPIGHRNKIGTSGLSNSNSNIGMDLDQDLRMGMDISEGLELDMDGSGNSRFMCNPDQDGGDISMTNDLSVVDFAYQNQYQPQPQPQQGNINNFHSAPTSPRGTRMNIDVDSNQMNRSSSAEPSSAFLSNHPNPSQIHPQTQVQSQTLFHAAPHQSQTHDVNHVGKDRISSLFTLIHSRPNTPLIPHPLALGSDSPTLFNGPNEMDHDIFPLDQHVGGRRMSFWSMSTHNGVNIPPAGSVGRLSLSKGSEGLGLGLGLEHVD